MGGLSGVGRSIGAGLSGFNQALAQDQQYRANEQRLSLGDMEMKQRQRQFQQQEDDALAEQEANQAGIQALEARRLKYEADAAAGAQIQAGTQQPGAAPAPWQPGPQDMIAAEQAAYDKLYAKGKYKAFNDRYARTEALRGQLRAKTGQQVLTAMQSGGDLTGALRQHDELMDDGTELLEAMPISSKDGKPAYRLRRKNRLTGEALPEADVSAEQLGMMVTTSMADPKAVATMNYQMYKQNAQNEAAAAKQEKRDEAAYKRALEVAKVQAGSREAVAETNAASRSEAARTRAGATLGAAQIRGSGRGAGAPASADPRKMDVRALEAESVTLSRLLSSLNQGMKDARPEQQDAIRQQIAEGQNRMRDVQATLNQMRRVPGGLSAAQPSQAPAPSGGAKDFSNLWN